jgi:hypothetical protein
MYLCETKAKHMKEITFQLTNPKSVIGFEKMVLIAITEKSMWFKCYYYTDFNGIKKVNIDLIDFTKDEFITIAEDYTITSK